MDMPSEIKLRSSASNRRCDHLSQHDIPVPNQAQDSVSFVLELDSFNVARSHGKRASDSFQRLNSCHLIDANGACIFECKPLWYLQISLADKLDFLAKIFRVFLFRV